MNNNDKDNNNNLTVVPFTAPEVAEENTVEEAFKTAQEFNLARFTLVGFTEDGECYIVNSDKDVKQAVYDMEFAKVNALVDLNG